jgi:hypothetical protein
MAGDHSVTGEFTGGGNLWGRPHCPGPFRVMHQMSVSIASGRLRLDMKKTVRPSALNTGVQFTPPLLR